MPSRAHRFAFLDAFRSWEGWRGCGTEFGHPPLVAGNAFGFAQIWHPPRLRGAVRQLRKDVFALNSLRDLKLGDNPESRRLFMTLVVTLAIHGPPTLI
jgi:hypothetical protein